MSYVKHFFAWIIIPGDTSQCVQNESYLLRSRSLHSGPRKTLKVVLLARLDLCWSGPNAAEFRTDAKPSGNMAQCRAYDGCRQADHLRGLYRERARGPEAPGSDRARSLLLKETIRNTKTSNHAQFGACRTRSLPLSKNWIRSLNSGQPQSWRASLRGGLAAAFRNSSRSILMTLNPSSPGLFTQLTPFLPTRCANYRVEARRRPT